MNGLRMIQVQKGVEYTIANESFIMLGSTTKLTDAMEDAALVVQWLSTLSSTLLASTKRPEVILHMAEQKKMRTQD